MLNRIKLQIRSCCFLDILLLDFAPEPAKDETILEMPTATDMAGIQYVLRGGACSASELNSQKFN